MLDKIKQNILFNKVPYPIGFNGRQWNSTQIKPVRKNIPRYLLQEFPNTHQRYIKSMFKKANKLVCPDIQFFNLFLKKKKIQAKRKQQNRLKHQQDDKRKRLEQHLQYALIIEDRKSNHIQQIMNQIDQLQNQKQKSVKFKSFTSRANTAKTNYSEQSSRNNFFGDTFSIYSRYVSKRESTKQKQQKLGRMNKLMSNKRLSLKNRAKNSNSKICQLSQQITQTLLKYPLTCRI